MTTEGARKAWLTRRLQNPLRFGVPSQAELILVGGFDPEKAEQMIKNLTKKIPVAKLPGIKETKFVKVKNQQVKKKLDDEFELIEILTSPRSVEAIRHTLFMSNVHPEDKALERGGAEALRNYYNGPGLRKRKLMQSGQLVTFANPKAKFIPKEVKN